MRKLSGVEEFLSAGSSGLANASLDCPFCGKTHYVPIQIIQIGRGIIKDVPQVVEKLLGRIPEKTTLIYDKAIEDIIQQSIIQPLSDEGFHPTPVPVGQSGFLLECETDLANHVADQLDPQTDIIIGAGSGVIGDMTKWIAGRVNKPFILIGTAPSMNGHASITAVMTHHDIKTSEWLPPAGAVIYDVDILANAPIPMLHAGMGDLAARAVCNADWKLSNLLRNTYFCPLPYQMTAENEKRYLEQAEKIGKSDPEAIYILSETILLSGLSMTVLEGETSPSSGAEHIISHFWDFLSHIRGIPKDFHGSQVGVACMLTMTLYDYIRKIDPAQIHPEKLLQTRPTLRQIQDENEKMYGKNATDFNQNAIQKYISDDQYLQYLYQIKQNWHHIWNQVDPFLAKPETFRQAFEKAGFPLVLSRVQKTRDHAREALMFGNRYRSRYTILDFAWEIGIFPDAIEEIIELSRV